MLSPKDSPRGKLLSQYVCARITKMDNVDIALKEISEGKLGYELSATPVAFDGEPKV